MLTRAAAIRDSVCTHLVPLLALQASAHLELQTRVNPYRFMRLPATYQLLASFWSIAASALGVALANLGLLRARV
jgi:hypothetical protein